MKNFALFVFFCLVVVTIRASDDLAALSDEFDDAASQADWLRLNDVEGWHADQLETWDVNTSRPGHMRLMPYTSAWYDDLRGVLVHKNITGDFVVTTRMQIGSRTDMTLAPSRLFSLAGIFIHDPRGITSAAPTPAATEPVWPPAAHGSDWAPDTDNYVFLSYGSAGNVGTWQYEVKTTVNGDSTLYYDDSGVPDSNTVELQLVKVGNTVVVMRRHPGGNWIVENRYPNAAHDLPEFGETLQVGITAYTDWGNIGSDYWDGGNPETQFHHNYSVLDGAAMNPDLIVDVDYFRFNRPSPELTEEMLQALGTSFNPANGQSTAFDLPSTGAGMYLGDQVAVIPELSSVTLMLLSGISFVIWKIKKR
ncbi:hypothetical protein P3T73_17895 [Kiritimatiellota bacterium B12222]|nr:hypothetical protein P3T73_17895 [Kiritimatiellota bacterium B12222]